jgi:hypothetical protein
VIVAPYIRIFDETVQEATASLSVNSPRVARIAANKDMCRKVKERVRSNPRLEDLPFHVRPSCRRCEYNDADECPLQKILVSEWDVLGLTYAKLQTLGISESATALDLLEKVKLPDNLILDEFVTGIMTTAPSVEIENPHAYLVKEFGIEARQLGNSDFEDMFWPSVDNLALQAEIQGKSLADGQHRIFENDAKAECETFFEDNFAHCWKFIEKLTNEGKDTRILQQLVQIINSDKIFIIKKEGKVSIKPLKDLDDISSGSRYLKAFVKDFFSTKKLVTLVDACLPDLNLEEDLGIDIEPYRWGDPLNTNKAQLIISDTRKISEIDFFKSIGLQTELKARINAICKFHGSKRVMVATQNTDMKQVVEAWRTSGEIPRDTRITYYRSDISRGTTPDKNRRFLVLIGGPYLPKEAYLPETYLSDRQTDDLQTAFKKSDMKSAFINLIGRVKDPIGIEPSIVYAFGVTAEEVKALVDQVEVQPAFVSRFPVTGAKMVDFLIVARLFLETPKEKWRNLGDDIGVLARIITKCEEEKEIQCGRLVPNQTEKLQRFVECYSDILRKHGIEIVKRTRGSSLVYRRG